MWPDVLQDIALLVKNRLLDNDGTIDIYIGASAAVPTNDQINIIGGSIAPDSNSVACNDKKLKVFIEVWVNPETEATGDSDADYENSLTIAGYKRLNHVTNIITATEIRGKQDPFYRSVLREILMDDDTFRPVFANRIELEVTY